MGHRSPARRLLLALIASLATTVGLVTPAHADPVSPGPADNANGWYLALGDSLAAGLQPTTGDEPTRGYAGPVLADLQDSQPKTKLVNLACSGESTTAMIQGGRCSYEEGSQLAQAEEFLHAHARTTRLVTLTMGSNNVLPCVHGTAIDQPCVLAGLATAQRELPVILARLRAAAPDAQIVVTSYYNPYAVAPDAATRAASGQLTGILNSIVAGSAAASGAQVADVYGTFHAGAPDAATYVCAWTWMCTPYRNVHANDAGYAAMADAVAAKL